MPAEQVMLQLPTVQLHHVTRSASHVDWLIEPPLTDRQGGRLWTWRCDRACYDWQAGRAMLLERIADHRRVYLDYQGPISGGRGEVRQVDRGWVRPVMWTGERLWLDLRMERCRRPVMMQRIDGARWKGRIIDS